MFFFSVSQRLACPRHSPWISHTETTIQVFLIMYFTKYLKLKLFNRAGKLRKNWRQSEELPIAICSHSLYFEQPEILRSSRARTAN